ncbi:MAG: GNAT family N-acetyltransferase [Peptostreptococcaceae bacterium]
MKLQLDIYDSSFKHIRNISNNTHKIISKLCIVKEESFAFQLMLKSDEKFFCQLGNVNDIHYLGLNNKIRIELELEESLRNDFKASFLGYIQNDNNELIGDQILNQNYMYIEEDQMLWIEGKIPSDFKKDYIQIKVKAYYTSEYESEILIAEEVIKIEVIDYVLPSVKESDFFLDLWQHPCNWARYYEVQYYSKEHFTIIDNFLFSMSNLGQKVIDLIVTDYPWAGQRCYEVHENANNLFEMNIVRVFKEYGEIQCDFSNLDKYIDLCFKYNINKEINLFGLVGNWDAFKFGSPLKNYKDAIRINYYDKDRKIFDYIKEEKDFAKYLNLLFNHLESRDLLDITKIMVDEPDNIEVFNENVAFIKKNSGNKNIKYKCAIHHQEFFEKCDINIENLSLNTCELINNINKLDDIKKELEAKNGYFTWYSCCFPDKLNVFLDSPLIESRLKGWFTYYCNLDGFLRWAYGVWPGDLFNNATYKKEKWKAGDMFLVYPGKDMKPMDSVRCKNLLFGIQDFNILKDMESKLDKIVINKEIENLLGKKSEMKFLGSRDIEMEYSLNYEDYMDLRKKLIKMIKPRSTKPEEFENVVGLINKVFRDLRGYKPTMQQEFPLLLNKNNVDNMIVISKDNKIVSDVNYLIQDVTIQGNNIKVASIGAVCTDPDYEGNRYSSSILDYVEEKMLNDGVDIVTISGTRSLYTRRKCSLVKNCYQYKTYPKDVNTHLEVKDYDKRYLNEMIEIYNQNSTRFLRSKNQFEALLESATIPWGNLTYKKLVILKDKKLIGYVILRIIDEKKLTGEIREICIDSMYNYEVVQYIANEYNLEYIVQNIHIKDFINQPNNYDEKEIVNLDGSVKIINYEKLCCNLNSYFKQYLDEDFLANIEFKTIDDKYIIKYKNEELVIDDIDKLNKLFLEGGYVVKEELKKLDNISKFVYSVLPINFVWTSNLNYQ